MFKSAVVYGEGISGKSILNIYLDTNLKKMNTCIAYHLCIFLFLLFYIQSICILGILYSFFFLFNQKTTTNKPTPVYRPGYSAFQASTESFCWVIIRWRWDMNPCLSSSLVRTTNMCLAISATTAFTLNIVFLEALLDMMFIMSLKVVGFEPVLSCWQTIILCAT